jgi:hypothetical protein
MAARILDDQKNDPQKHLSQLPKNPQTNREEK